MFVVWRSRERKLKSLVRHSARLVESVRVNGKPRQTFVSFLGSYEARTAEGGAPNPDEALQFWRSARAALDVRGIHGEDRARIEDALAQRIPPTGHAFEDSDPEPMSPVDPGYMPLYCAAHWIATQGRSIDINPRDVEVWRPVYDDLLARISSGDVEVIGDREDGVTEQVAGLHFAQFTNSAHSDFRRIVYPFQKTPLKLLLGGEAYLCDDTLRRGRVDRWRRLMVRNSDVLRYWPFGANEPAITQARNAVEDAGIDGEPAPAEPAGKGYGTKKFPATLLDAARALRDAERKAGRVQSTLWIARTTLGDARWQPAEVARSEGHFSTLLRPFLNAKR